MAKNKTVPMDAQADTHEATPPQPAAPQPLRIAYHAGPQDIVFAGRNWRRGVAQPVTPDELKSMTRRAGWVTFEFRAIEAARPADD